MYNVKGGIATIPQIIGAASPFSSTEFFSLPYLIGLVV